MAKGESKFTITAETVLDPNTQKLMDLMTAGERTIRIYTQPAPGMGAANGGATTGISQGAKRSLPANDLLNSSSGQKLQIEYMRTFLTKYVPDFAKHAKEFKALSGELTAGIRGIGGLGRGAVGLGGFGSAGAAGAMAAAYFAMAQGAASRARFASGVGGSVGGVSAANIYLGRYLNAQSDLPNIVRGQRDLGSQQFSGLAQLGLGNRPNEDPGKLLGEAAVRWNEISKRMDKSTALTLADAMNISSLFSQDELIRIQDANTEELKTQIRLAEAHKEEYNLTKEQSKVWTDLMQKVNGAGAAIETYFEKKLIDSAPEFEKTIDDITKFGKDLGDLSADIVHYGNVTGNVLNTINDASSNLGKATHDFIAKYIHPIPGKDIPPATHPWDQPMTFPDGTPGDGKLVMPGDLPSEFATPKSFEQTTGGDFAIPGSTTEIEKLNKEVINTTKSLQAFNEKLMVGGSGTYLVSRAGGAIGAAGGFVTTLGPGGAPISAAGIYGGGGGFAGVGDGRSGAPGGIVGRGTGGAAARPAKGALKANQREAYNAAIASGLSDSSARALVANMSGEALSDPGNVHWDVSHTARGIVQWDPARSEAIKRQFGKYPNEMSVADQTKAAIWEMQNNPKYKDTWAALQSGGSVEDKIGTLVRNYERPRDTGGAISSRIGFAKGLPASMGDGKTPDVSGASGNWGIKDNEDVLDHLKSARDKGLITNEQCVSLATASVGIKLGSGKEGANVHDWRKGDAALAGGLKPGTPIATFLDRNFGSSNLYAGGGSGTPGAHKDHAAVFENYIRDKNGKIIGMDVGEQFAGSGGTHEHPYYFGKGRGEGDASNYYAVKTASGEYLGGAANPMSRRDVAGAPKPHIGDMSQYNINTGIKMHINNAAGADVAAQTAMIGSAQGNFG